MSTFSGLSTALSSLTAQRRALEVAGQNIANANTVGYTRQRAEMQSVGSSQTATMFSRADGIGSGVQATSISRLGDLFLDARVRTTTSSAAYLAERTEAYTRLESTIAEPGANGLSRQLDDFWATWQDVSNNAGNASSGAAGQVLIEGANAVQRGIATGYAAVSTQWEQTRGRAESLVSEINTTAASVAELNDKIRQVEGSGGSSNELRDQRDLLTTSLAALSGATVRMRDDGMVDVSVGGNPLVSGDRVQRLVVTGSPEMAGAAGNPVRLEWDRTPASPATLDGGRLAGVLSVLAPADANGTGGVLAQAAESYNALAETLARTVNTIHQGSTVDGVRQGGWLADGTPAGAVFSFTGSGPSALALTVTITDPAKIAAGTGGTDGSIADKISQIGTQKDSPDQEWAAFVVATGVRAKSSAQSATVAEVARSTAAGLQLAQTSVDLDEESVNMLSFQRAYQGASRVMTAIDEMLDQLINRTGVVGR